MLTWDQIAGTMDLKDPALSNDKKVAVDNLSTPGFICATGTEGVFRVNTTFDYVDGGDFVTLGLADNSVSTVKLVDDAVTTANITEAKLDITTAAGVGTDGHVLSWDNTAGKMNWIAPSSGTDAQVGVDGSATAGYISAASSDGVLRTDAKLDYTDGGNFVTIGLSDGSVTTAKLAADAVDNAKLADNSVDGTNLALGSDAAGDLIHYDGTGWVRLAKGAADQVLTMNDGATAPNWENASGGGSSVSVGVRAAMSSDIALISSIETTINFATESFDVGTDHSGTTFTAPSTGYYQVNSSITALLPARGQFGIRIYSNGSRIVQDSFIADQSDVGSCITSAFVYLTSGQTVQVKVFQDSGFAYTVYSVNSHLSVMFVGS